MIRGESFPMYGEKSILASIMFGRRQALHPGPWIRKYKETHRKRGKDCSVCLKRNEAEQSKMQSMYIVLAC